MIEKVNVSGLAEESRQSRSCEYGIETEYFDGEE